MYVDYEYYRAEYGGKMPEEAFPAAKRKAEAYIRYLTHLNGDIFSIPNDMVALRAVMRLGWEIPNPINSVQTDKNKRCPFAILKNA